ncbi:MAG: nicotinamide riboside transporter PnuC [Bacteroidales bacterium]|nr:nicotinamide riboside transporter PnuC [Bacteroidales bacterium]
MMAFNEMTDLVLFRFGDSPVLMLDFAASLLGLTCVFLAGRNSEKNFWVGYVYGICLFALFLKKGLYAAMALQVISFVINVFGHYRWTHPKENERSEADAGRLKVSSLGKRQWVLSLLGAATAGTLLALYLKTTSDPSPGLDAYIMTLTLLAQYLSAQKRWECWIVWIAINAANIALYINAGLQLMPIISGLYLTNGIWSLVSWLKLYRKNE